MADGRAEVKPQKIGQIAVHVEDVERATAFYRDVLGLPHLFSAPPGLSFFSCGEVRLMLSEAEAGEGVGSSIIYYDVVDVEEAHERLMRGGAEEVASPRSVHKTDLTDLWMGFYRDTEGNVFATMTERSRSDDGAL